MPKPLIVAHNGDDVCCWLQNVATRNILLWMSFVLGLLFSKGKFMFDWTEILLRIPSDVISINDYYLRIFGKTLSLFIILMLSG